MRFAKVTAIIRCARLKEVEERLRTAGVDGMTVSHVKGFGEYANFYRQDWTTTHARIELFLPRGETERVAGIITDAARTGVPGDGIVAILPVARFYHIRTHRGSADGATADCRDDPALVD